MTRIGKSVQVKFFRQQLARKSIKKKVTNSQNEEYLSMNKKSSIEKLIASFHKAKGS